MPKYVIERTVPGAARLDGPARRELAQQSVDVLHQLGPEIQWVHSYVVDDKLFCVYNSAGEELIREHARCGGFPVDRIYEVATIIDPVTAEPQSPASTRD